MKKVGIKLMNGGPLKINRPTSHPSNPIHRQVSEKQSKKLSSSISEKIMQSDSVTKVILSLEKIQITTF